MDVCAIIRARLRRAGAPKGVKVGHGGTLDPLATGVLVVLIGKATRLCDQIMATRKTYVAGVTPYTSTFVLAECCVFVKQSQPPILCGPLQLRLYAFTYQGHTLSRSYGVNLPSSFS